MDRYAINVSQQDISPKWPLFEINESQNKVEELSHLCGIQSPDNIKKSLLQRDGLYLNFPESRIEKQININKKPTVNHKLNSKNKKSKNTQMLFTNLQFKEKEIVPGYQYSRTPNAVKVTLTDEFWRYADGRCSSYTIGKAESDEKFNTDDISHIVNSLNQEINRLQLFYEAEKLARKTDLKKIKDDHTRQLSHLQEEHLEQIRAAENSKDNEIISMQEQYENKLQELSISMELKHKVLENEISFLKEELVTQNQLSKDEFERECAAKETELNREMEFKIKTIVLEQKKELLQEKELALNQLTVENNERLTKNNEQHRQEMDRTTNRFCSSLQEADQLKVALEELKALREENTDLKARLEDTTENLRKTGNELGDSKMKLSGFEKNFFEKVSEIEERYSMKVDDLTKTNLDLSRKYLRKCEELHSMSIERDAKQIESAIEAEDLMQEVIRSVTRTNTSLAAARESDIEHSVEIPAMLVTRRKYSTPVTDSEKRLAVIKSSKQQIEENSKLHIRCHSSREHRKGHKIVLPLIKELKLT